MRMKRRRKNKLVLKRYAFILGVLMCITAFITSLISEFDVYANNNIKTSESFDEANGIKYLKTATPTKNEGEYEITFKVEGTPTTETVPVDVLMIMDTSGSMKNDIINLKTAMKNFTNNILTNVKDSRISVIEFADERGISKNNSNFNDEPYNDKLEESNNKHISNSSKGENKTELNKDNNREKISNNEKANLDKVEKPNNENNKLYSSSKEKKINTTISNDNIETRGSREDAKVLHNFSNDIQSINNAIDKTTANGGTNAEAAWLLAKQQLEGIEENRKSNKYVIFFTDGLPNKTTLFMDFGNPIRRALNAYNETINYIGGLKSYSVGLVANIDSEGDKETAKNFLQKVQNSGRFLIENKNGSINLDKIYETIADNIKKDTAMATNTIIADEVTKEFDIIPDSNIQVIKPGVDGKEDEILNIQPTINGNKISFNLGDVGTEGRIIKFRIKLKKEYYGIGDEKIKTNVNATMNYKDKNNQDKEITFQVPEVNIPYKKGSITIEKEVINKDGLKAPKDDNFNILLKGNSNSYAFNLKGGESKKINFTLKHKDAKVSDENLAKQDFLNIGEFNIKEIVPMNYEIQSIIVNNENVTNNPKVTINNVNTDIKIKITNKYVNDNYFYDKDEKKNLLKVGK